jgi:hypothetical protein
MQSGFEGKTVQVPEREDVKPSNPFKPLKLVYIFFQRFFGTKYGSENFVGFRRKSMQSPPFVFRFVSSHL